MDKPFLQQRGLSLLHIVAFVFHLTNRPFHYFKFPTSFDVTNRFRAGGILIGRRTTKERFSVL